MSNEDRIRFNQAALFGGNPWRRDDTESKYYDKMVSDPVVGERASIIINGARLLTSTVQETGEDGAFRTRSRWYIKRPEGVPSYVLGPDDEEADKEGEPND